MSQNKQPRRRESVELFAPVELQADSASDQFEVDSRAVEAEVSAILSEIDRNQDVELTEDDMNDPELLAEMNRIERGDEQEESHKKPPANSQQNNVSTQKQTAALDVSTKMEITEDENLDGEQMYHKELSDLLTQRLGEYHAAALHAKNNNLDSAKSLVSVYLKIKSMIEAHNAGELLDIEDVPAAPKKAVESPKPQTKAPSTPTKPSTPVSHTTSEPSSKTPTADKKIAPVIVASPEPTPGEIRERKFVALESMLLKQAEDLKAKALAANAAGRKADALAIINKRKAIVSDLELIRLAHSTPPTPPPTFHIEIVERAEEVVHTDVSTHEMQISITKLVDIKPPSLGETVIDSYVVCELYYPDPTVPTRITTPVVKGTLSPVFNFTQKVRIDRNKGLLRCIKKKVIFQVWKPKTWIFGSAKMIGRAELKIGDLTDKSEIAEELDILEESGHKITGGKMQVSIRLRTPLINKEYNKIKEKVLVIDKHHIDGSGNTEPVDSNQTSPNLTQSVISTVTGVSPNTPTTQVTQTEDQISSSQLMMSQMPDSSSNASQSQVPVQTQSPSNQVDKSKPPAPDQKQAENNTPLDYDFNGPGWIISHAVLEWRKECLESEIAKCKAGNCPAEKLEELEEKKGDIEHKITLLIVLVQNGTLSQDEYIRRVKSKLKDEQELLERLKSVQRTEEANMCAKRIEIMKAEIGV